MKIKLKKFHFASPTNDKIVGLAKRIYEIDAILCFDLEDIIRKVFDNDVDNKLHGEKVKYSIKCLIKSAIKPTIGLRVNVYGSKEFYDDLEVLEEINRMVSLRYIFLPKIEGVEEIQECDQLFKKRKIAFAEIIPIIENKRTFDNLGKIISASRKIINNIAFGHCDYNYDNGFFPFYHQDNNKYWEWVNSIVNVTKQYNILFINSPYLSLNDDNGFLNTISRLSQQTNGTFGQITLSYNQMTMCALFENDPRIQISYINKIDSDITSNDIARTVIKDYENNKIRDRSFSINKSRILISPQEYFAAKKYLAAMEIFNVSED